MDLRKINLQTDLNPQKNMHNPYPSLVNQLIKDRFLINQSIFTNDKTLVYDVLDIKIQFIIALNTLNIKYYRDILRQKTFFLTHKTPCKAVCFETYVEMRKWRLLVAPGGFCNAKLAG